MPEFDEKWLGVHLEDVNNKATGFIIELKLFLSGKDIEYKYLMGKADKLLIMIETFSKHEIQKYFFKSLKSLIDKSLVIGYLMSRVTIAHEDRLKGVDPKKSAARFFTSPKFWIKQNKNNATRLRKDTR